MNHKTLPTRAIVLWGGQTDSLKLISEGINIVYQFTINNDIFYLRITHAKLRSEKELVAAICFQNYLYEKNVPVCQPILSKYSHWFERIEDDNEIYLVHVCKEVLGNTITFDGNAKLYFNWGKSLGLLHQAALQFSYQASQYVSWDESLDELAKYVKQEETYIQRIFEQVNYFFRNKPVTTFNFGLTHGDHREGNILAHHHNAFFIDFDLPSRNWFMDDFCRPFFDAISYGKNTWQNIFNDYKNGYFSVMPKESLNLDTESFVRQYQFKALEIYLWMKNNWAGDIAPGGANTNLWLNAIYHQLSHEDNVINLFTKMPRDN
tara:strand:- start:181 stop:1140 length:960 start_codon:yes stop_codon:yes gene_type:complete